MPDSAPVSPDDLLATAIAAARAAGTHGLRNRERRTEVHEALHNDVKLKLDLECQAIATETILKAHPDHAILGEESSDSASQLATRDVYQWIIDPIDGTVNFSHNLPFWCTSVAVRINGQVQAGAVYGPVLNELFSASRTGPACLNGFPIHASPVTRLSDAIVMTGVAKTKAGEKPLTSYFQAILENVQRPRIVGSAALDLCSVAAGRADGYFESSIYIWDIAAAGLILERAGGRTEVLDDYGSNRMSFLGTNAHIHEAMRQILINAR